MKNVLIRVFIVFSVLLTAGCGVKPPYVDPPNGAEHDTFPKTYPNIITDPQPGLEYRALKN